MQINACNRIMEQYGRQDGFIVFLLQPPPGPVSYTHLSAASAWLLSSADVLPAAASWAEELQPERAAAVMAAVNRIDKPLFLINPSSFFGLQRF